MADEMPNEEQSTRARTGSGAERWALVLVPVLLIGVGLAACGAGGGTAATTVGSSSSTTELTAPTTSSAVAAPCAALAELAATGQDASQVGEAAATLTALEPALRQDISAVASALLGQPQSYGPDPSAALPRIVARFGGACPQEVGQLESTLQDARGVLCVAYRKALQDAGAAAETDADRVRAALAVNADPALIEALGRLGSSDANVVDTARQVVRSYLEPVCGP